MTKKCHSDPRVTIDSLHSAMMSEIPESDKCDYYLDNGLLLDKYYSGNITNQPQENKGILGYFKQTEVEPDNESGDIIQKYMSNIDDTN